MAVAGSNRQTAAKMTNDILHGIFSMHYMASHCLTDGQKDKEGLPADVVNRIIGLLFIVYTKH